MIKALSAALFHFLWQGAVLALAPALALMFRSPRIRYAAACAALFAMPVVFCITMAVSLPEPGAHAAMPVQLHPAARFASDSAVPFSPPFDFAQSMRWFVPFWAAGVVLFYLRTCAGWFAIQRLRRTSSAPAPAFWKEKLTEISARLGVRRAVALFQSELVDVPLVAGFLRPAIFVPAALFAGMPAEQLEYLLIHELAHIRRFDYAVNLLQTAVEGLLFYHPAVWWVSRVLRTERENCCDDAVIAVRGNAREYASVLARLELSRSAPALAASGGNLSKRVMRLLNRPQRNGAGLIAGLLIAAVTAGVAWAALQEPKQQTVQRQAMPEVYRRWIAEDVVYIVTDEERRAFQALTTDDERNYFIEQFWQRRDPTPGTPANEFKDEHYRRIGFVNSHFTDASVPGWKTDRGRIYITYGPPDEIDSHHGDAAPWELWRYRFIQGIGENVILQFTDHDHNGRYLMDRDPTLEGRGRGAGRNAVPPPREQDLVQSTPTGIILSIPLDPTRKTNVFARITTPQRRPVSTMEKPAEHEALLQWPVSLKAGSYRVTVVTKDADTPGSVAITQRREFTVP